MNCSYGRKVKGAEFYRYIYNQKGGGDDLNEKLKFVSLIVAFCAFCAIAGLIVSAISLPLKVGWLTPTVISMVFLVLGTLSFFVAVMYTKSSIKTDEKSFGKATLLYGFGVLSGLTAFVCSVIDMTVGGIFQEPQGDSAYIIAEEKYDPKEAYISGSITIGVGSLALMIGALIPGLACYKEYSVNKKYGSNKVVPSTEGVSSSHNNVEPSGKPQRSDKTIGRTSPNNVEPSGEPQRSDKTIFRRTPEKQTNQAGVEPQRSGRTIGRTPKRQTNQAGVGHIPVVAIS